VLAVPRPSPDEDCLSWSCATLQSFDRNQLAPVLVGCSPHALWLAPGSRVFADSGVREPLTRFSDILSWAYAPLQRPRAPSGRLDHRLPRGQTVQSNRLPSLRFSAPTAFPRSRQQHDGLVCLTRPLAPSGFLNLSTLSSTASLPALFHAGSALGVLPFRALLLPCSRSPSPASFPSCRCANRPTEPSTRPRAPKRLLPRRTGHPKRYRATEVPLHRASSSRRSDLPISGPSSHRSDLADHRGLPAAEATF
jgi:hypothetical protein